MMRLLLKNTPHDLLALLKENARRNRRSLSCEILARLENSFSKPVTVRGDHVKTLRNLVASLPRVDHFKVIRYKWQGRA